MAREPSSAVDKRCGGLQFRGFLYAAFLVAVKYIPK